ncbi:hypothetical protein [Paenibacillus terrae]|uniref:hypothetical protein n=1 Tax=Paenibacillus terrae TaxID=159743 RepID=UPI0021CC61AA|nr:hypothetical protein [Paenibacillus terrae]
MSTNPIRNQYQIKLFNFNEITHVGVTNFVSHNPALVSTPYRTASTLINSNESQQDAIL